TCHPARSAYLRPNSFQTRISRSLSIVRVQPVTHRTRLHTNWWRSVTPRCDTTPVGKATGSRRIYPLSVLKDNSGQPSDARILSTRRSCLRRRLSLRLLLPTIESFPIGAHRLQYSDTISPNAVSTSRDRRDHSHDYCRDYRSARIPSCAQ